MKNERMRVRARVLLVGKQRVGRALLVFLLLLRLAVRVLATLAALKAVVLVASTGGRVVLALSVFAVVSAFLLCECLRTVRDRWYLAVCNGEPVSVTRLIVGFSFSDFWLSLKNGAVVRICSFFRAAAFLAFPLCFTAFAFWTASRGVSAAVLGVLLAGSMILLLVGGLFAFVSLSCVRLARALCCYDATSFRLRMGSLELSAVKLFGYSVTLGLFNPAYRYTAKLIFASNFS